MSLGRLVSIVDDERDILELFRDAITGINGMTVFTFTDPILALEHFQMNQYAYVMVLSDFRMPDLNGVELLDKIKDLNTSVRTILMTAFAVDDKMFRDYTKKKIINGFIQKPVRLSDLIKEVHTQLHYYEMQK